MTKVRSIYSDDQSQRSLIDVLERMLEDARSGELIAFSGAILFAGNAYSPVTVNHEADPTAMIGVLRTTSHIIERDVVQALE